MLRTVQAGSHYNISAFLFIYYEGYACHILQIMFCFHGGKGYRYTALAIIYASNGLTFFKITILQITFLSLLQVSTEVIAISR